MDEYYCIVDIDRDILLEELWNNSTNKYNSKDYKFSIKIAKMQMHCNYPDYICGRPIKVDIYNEDKVSGYLYDRENGYNAFYNVLQKLRGIEVCYQESKELPIKLDCNNKNYREAMELYNELFRK